MGLFSLAGGDAAVLVTLNSACGGGNVVVARLRNCCIQIYYEWKQIRCITQNTFFIKSYVEDICSERTTFSFSDDQHFTFAK